MKLFLTSVFALLSTIAVMAQTFEGKITYQNSFTSKMPNVTNDQFNGMMGNKQEYFIKGGNYKSVSNGTFSQYQMYINKDNKLYSKIASSEALLWNDCMVNLDSVLKVTVNRAVVDILGYKCDEVILTCKTGVQKYYFSSKLAIDAKLFVNHKYGNFYDFVKLSNAVPLKMVIETEQMSMVSIATEVKAMKLDDKEFQLPAGVKTEKSPY